MSCQRCGGVLAAELAAAMYELVCGRVVIENRYCHCDDVGSPVQTNLPQEGRGTLGGELAETTKSEEGDTMIGYGKRVLVVDDTETIRLLLAGMLERHGFTVVQACDGRQALNEMWRRHFDVVVTDYQMPHLNGLDLLRQSHTVWPDIPVIIVSGTQENLDAMVAAHGGYGWIQKPFDADFLVNMVRSAVNLATWEQASAMSCPFGSRASETTEFFTKKMVIAESRSVQS